MSCINELLKKEVNEATKGITDITNLGLYLAQHKNEKALRILNWLVVAIQNDWIDKEMDFNKPKKTKINHHSHYDTIASRLIENPRYISKEVFDYIAKTNKIDFNFRPYGTYTLKEMMVKIVEDIRNPESKFYKQEDAAKKTLETILYFAHHGTMNINKTMGSMLISALNDENVSLEIKEVIKKIFDVERTPHMRYDDKIKLYLERQKEGLLEIQKRNLTEADCLYFANVLQPKLERNVIKLK